MGTKKEDKKANRKNSGIWKGAIIALMSGLIGMISSFGITAYWENYKEEKARNELTKMLYTDILNNVTTLYIKLGRSPESKVLDDLINKKQILIATHYDMSIMDAYIHQISLLPHKTSARILAFYGELKYINTTVSLFQNKDIKMSDEAKKHWIEFMFKKRYKSIRNGKELMRVFEQEYDINPEPFQRAKGNYDKIHKKIIEAYPELKKKLTIQHE